jgi:uncharacterized membrane protein YgcG
VAFGSPSWLRRGLAGPQHRHHAHGGSHAVSNAVFHAYRQAVFHQHWLAHRNAVVAAHRRAIQARHNAIPRRALRYTQRVGRATQRAGRVVGHPRAVTPPARTPVEKAYRAYGRFLSSAIHASQQPPLASQVGRAFAPALSYTGKHFPTFHTPSFTQQVSNEIKSIVGGKSKYAIPGYGEFQIAKDLTAGKPGKALGHAVKTTLASSGYEQTKFIPKAEAQFSTKVLGPPLHKLAKGLHAPKHPVAVGTPFGTVKIGKGPTKVAFNALKDVVNLPAEAIPSTYYMLAHPQEAIKQFPKTDPLGRLIFHGDPRGLAQHPVIAALEASGGIRGLSRGVGRAGRVAGVKAFSTAREPAIVPRTQISAKRFYSPDPLVKAAQVLRERSRIAKATDLHAKANRLEQQGKTRQAKVERAKAIKIDPGIAKGAEIRQRLNERVAANEDVRRFNRARVATEAAKVRKLAGDRAHALSLVAQGITKANPKDLTLYRDQLAFQHHHGDLTPAEKTANEQLRSHIDTALKGKGDFAKLGLASQHYASLMRPIEHQLAKAEMLPASQAEKSRLIPYAVRHMGATHDPNVGIVDRMGLPLTTERIRAHMVGQGVKPSEVSYLSQEPSMRGAKNFYRNWAQPQNATGGAVRTGLATAHGTFDIHPDVVVEQAARSQGLLDAHNGFQGFVNEFGIRKKGGEVLSGSYRDVKKEAQNIAERSGRQLQPIRLNPWLGHQEQLQHLLDQTAGEPLHGAHAEAMHQSLLIAMHDSLEGKAGPGPWGLVDRAAADQLQQHLRLLGPGSGGKLVQKLNSLFRQTVLSTSVKWLTGNTVEASVRTALVRGGPRSYFTGRKLLKGMGPEQQARTVAGGHYSMAERQAIRRTAEHFQGTKIEPLAKGLGAFFRAPGGRNLAHLWQRWTQLVFHDVNGRLEKQFQVAMLGRYARENLMPDHAIKTTGKAIEQAAQGLKNTNEQVAAGRWIDRAYGQYGKFSPAARRNIALYTPFVAWSLNAARFIFSVLPKDHPVVTALLASSNAVSEEWRKQHGLDWFIKKRVPGFLQGSIPLGGGKSQRGPARYTPFGAFSDPLDTAASAVIPQWRDSLNALQGRDWKGDKIRVKGGGDLGVPERGVNAIIAFAGSTIPLVGQGLRVGNVAALGEKKKPGDISQRIQRELNPFYPSQKTTSTRRRRRKSGGGNSFDGVGGSSSGGGSGNSFDGL